jgi:hypothetical protein
LLSANKHKLHMPNEHVVVRRHYIYPPNSDICQYNSKCIDPAWLQRFMLQVTPRTSKVSILGRELPLNMFACGVMELFEFICFPLWTLLFELAMSYASCNKYILDHTL